MAATRSRGLDDAQDAPQRSKTKRKGADTSESRPLKKSKAYAASGAGQDDRDAFFATGSQLPSPPPESQGACDDSGDDDDVLPNTSPKKVIGFAKHWFNHKYGILEKQAGECKKYFIQSPKQYELQPDTKSLDSKLKPSEQITRISAVANYFPKKFKGHYLDLLNPDRWGKKPPLSKIQVTGDGGRVLWVDRKAVRKHWPGGEEMVPVTEDLKVGDYVVLEKGQMVYRADLAIARKAVRSEVNYRRCKSGQRPLSRSPSPMATTEGPVPTEGDAVMDSVEDASP